MGCPKLHEGWVFLRGGEKHLLFPRKPREKNRSRSAPAEMDDGNKNVVGLLDKQGKITAEYAYSPYGGLAKSSGPDKNSCPFLFSSEYLDTETNLVYYNYRYYTPELGRWTKRDVVFEQGGLNIYANSRNDLINRWDVLGLVKSFYNRKGGARANICIGDDDGKGPEGLAKMIAKKVRLDEEEIDRWLRDENGQPVKKTTIQQSV